MQREDQPISAEHYLDIVCRNIPSVNRVISEYGNVSLLTYLQHFTPVSGPSYQSRDDLLDVVYHYAAPLLGESVARRTVRDLAVYPVVRTANHHGVDYLSQLFQGSLIFSLNVIAGATPTTTIPIFSCGNVPLNNVTYPRGILLYHVNSAGLETMPQKLPIFPNRLRKCIVSVVPAFDQAMVKRTEAVFDKMVRNGQVSPTLTSSLNRIFGEDYSDPTVIALPDYSQQAVILNNRIWKRLFSGVEMIPEMVYLEQEKIAAALLERDLSNPQSLVWSVLFDAVLREHVLTELDGVDLCWDLRKLSKRAHLNIWNEASKKTLETCGTIFFWGIDHGKKRVPLFLETDTSANPVLRGVDNHGKILEFSYTSQALICGLRENTLIPSGFTFFLTLSLARGLTCNGGYFQCQYLPMMQQGVITALKNTPGYHDVASLVAQVPTDYYLESMLAVMTRLEDGALIPAGPVEIIAGGGITNDDIEQMLALTVREAHLADMVETALDAVPSELRPPGWKKQLAKDCFRLLQGKIVVK